MADKPELSKIQAEDRYRSSPIQSDSIDLVKRTVPMTMATNAPVKTYHWDLGWYMEILSFNKDHVRTARLDSGGMNVLDNHSRYSSHGVYGVIDSYDLKANSLEGVARFSQRTDDAHEGIWTDVKDKILRNVSLGYSVYKYKDMNPTRKEGELPIYMAIDWEPKELSLSPVQADVNSMTRAEADKTHTIEIIKDTENQRNMADPVIDPAEVEQLRKDKADLEKEVVKLRGAGAPPKSEEPPVNLSPADAEKLRSEGIQMEKTRQEEITTALEKAGINDPEFKRSLIDGGVTIDVARQQIIEKFAANDPTKNMSNTQITKDERDKTREIMVDSLISRSGKEQYLPEVVKKDRNHMAEIHKRSDMTLYDIARRCLEDAGVNTRDMGREEIIGRSITNSTSDFPILMAGLARTILLGSYELRPDSWREFCKIGSVTDFRPHHRVRNGSIGNLDTIQENGEYRQKAYTDAEKESISADTKGNIINISRKMIINDDLGGFADLAERLGRASDRTIEAAVFALLLSNPTMGDGKTLFHADHGNIGAGGAVTADVLEADRVQMASQKEKDGNDYLMIRPEIALVSLAQRGKFSILNESQYNPDATNKLQMPNLSKGLFNKIVDTPYLTGVPYYLFANPALHPVLEVVFLNGQQTPFLDTDIPFNVDGMSWKIRHDWGVGAIGFRGVLKGSGA